MQEWRKRVPRGFVHSRRQRIGFKIVQSGRSGSGRVRKHGPGPDNLGLRLPPSGDRINNSPTSPPIHHAKAMFIAQYIRNAKALLGQIVSPDRLVGLDGALRQKAREAWNHRNRSAAD